MDVNLLQLPIPDWGLTCPRCGYLLRGLPEHRCPECGLKLDITQIVHPWTRLREPTFTGRERPLPVFGMKCRACRKPLAGATAANCPSCAAEFDSQSWRPVADMFTPEPWMTEGLTTVAVERVLLDEHIPHTAREAGKSLGEIYGLGVIPSVERQLDLSVSSEFFFDFLAAMQQEKAYWAGVRNAGRGPQWKCPKCGEECPGNFTLCWNCGAAK